MRQLSLEHFQKTLSVENVSLDSPELKEKEEFINGEVIPPNDPLDLAPIDLAPTVRIPLALKTVIAAHRINSKTELICALTQGLPKNELHLPLVIYRPDVLDHAMFNDIKDDKYEQLLTFLNAAAIPINYYEGFPALPDGQPIWARFEFESPEDHDQFEKYLNLPGARQLPLLTEITAGRATELFHTYYWSIRAQSSDAFAVAHYQRQREQRILKTDDKHFLEAEKLLDRLTKMASSVEWDLLKAEPDKFVKTLALVTELQRKALGMSNFGKNENSGTGAAQSIEVTMRKVTATTDVPTVDITEEDDIDLRSILNNAPDVQTLQELVLRIGQRK